LNFEWEWNGRTSCVFLIASCVDAWPLVVSKLLLLFVSFIYFNLFTIKFLYTLAMLTIDQLYIGCSLGTNQI